MVSPRQVSDRLELGDDWVNARDGARIVGTYDDHFTRSVGSLLTRKSRSNKGKGARSVGYAYLKADCDRVAEIRQALGVTAVRAAQLLHGIRRLGELGMLDGIESQQNLNLHDAQPRRRFQ